MEPLICTELVLRKDTIFFTYKSTKMFVFLYNFYFNIFKGILSKETNVLHCHFRAQ